MDEPLVVEVSRGPLVESRHTVHAVVADRSGILEQHGDGALVVHPRSSVKPIQALPLVTTGAADAADLDPVELSLACASHAGEERHVAAVRTWLRRVGLQEDDLECGVQSGRPGGPAANNCSGKHAGFLTLARHLEVDPAGYIEPGHPVQAAVTAALESVFEIEFDPTLAGVDGCGIPVNPMPLAALARGVARSCDPPADWPGDRAAAARRISAAMRAEPSFVAGTGRFDTDVMTDIAGIISKTGAEGVHVLGAVGGDWAAAVKVVDGATRAAEAVALHLLEVVGHDLSPRLRARRTLTNWTGTEVGQIRVSPISTG